MQQDYSRRSPLGTFDSIDDPSNRYLSIHYHGVRDYEHVLINDKVRVRVKTTCSLCGMFPKGCHTTTCILLNWLHEYSLARNHFPKALDHRVRSVTFRSKYALAI